MPNTCKIADCNRLVHGRDLCSRHYKRWQIYGDPNFVRVTQKGWGEPSKIVVHEDISYVELTQGKFALIDTSDIDIVSPHGWCLTGKGPLLCIV